MAEQLLLVDDIAIRLSVLLDHQGRDSHCAVGEEVELVTASSSRLALLARG